MSRPVPDGFKVKGVSTYYNRDGQPVGQWVKSTADEQRQKEVMDAVLKGMADDIPRAESTNFNRVCNASLHNCYVITDFHLGALSWAPDTGASWDLGIAERTLIAWF